MAASNTTNLSVAAPTTVDGLAGSTFVQPVSTTVRPTGSCGVPWSTSSETPQLFARDNEGPEDEGWSPGYAQSFRKKSGR